MQQACSRDQQREAAWGAPERVWPYHGLPMAHYTNTSVQKGSLCPSLTHAPLTDSCTGALASRSVLAAVSPLGRRGGRLPAGTSWCGCSASGPPGAGFGPGDGIWALMEETVGRQSLAAGGKEAAAGAGGPVEAKAVRDWGCQGKSCGGRG